MKEEVAGTKPTSAGLTSACHVFHATDASKRHYGTKNVPLTVHDPDNP